MWYMEKLPARGGIVGSTATTTFEGHTFEAEEDLLIRETVQNAKDVPIGKQKPKVVIRLVTLSGAKKAAFLKATELKQLYGNSALLARAAPFSELRTAGAGKPLSLLYIEDFNTTGLDGRLDDPKGNWMRFNLHGDAAKLEEQGKIGSYGYGKAVLARAAGTNSFIVYTAVRPVKGDAASARLMGHTFQPWYLHGTETKSGRGWLCHRMTADADPIPFTDEAAHKLAEEAGFTSRRDGKTGTSFLLIGNQPSKKPITIDAIRRAIETWWWPSLIENQLDIELWNEGKRVSDPSPRTRSDLQPYIQCKARLDTGVGADIEASKFYRVHGKQLGSLALTLAADDSIFDHPLHAKSPGTRRVARMRADSGMITEYKEFGTARRVAFVGFYCGSKDVDNALKHSEPAEHDEWSKVSQRLARVPHGADIVAAIEERTQVACLAYQRKNSASRAPLTDRLPELERLLGAAFQQDDGGPARSKPKKKPPVPHGRLTIVSYPGNKKGRPEPTFGKNTNQLNFLIKYSLKPNVTKRTKVSAWLRINVAEDANCTKGEPLQVEIIDQALRRPIYIGSEPIFSVDLEPGKSKTYRVVSSSYPRHQVVLFEEGEAHAPVPGKVGGK